MEFEDVKSCEEAYFKMENVLIDERRVHVDFSQSVGKLWNKYRRNESVAIHDREGKGDYKEKQPTKRQANFCQSYLVELVCYPLTPGRSLCFSGG